MYLWQLSVFVSAAGDKQSYTAWELEIDFATMTVYSILPGRLFLITMAANEASPKDDGDSHFFFFGAHEKRNVRLPVVFSLTSLKRLQEQILNWIRRIVSFIDLHCLVASPIWARLNFSNTHT